MTTTHRLKFTGLCLTTSALTIMGLEMVGLVTVGLTVTGWMGAGRESGRVGSCRHFSGR